MGDCAKCGKELKGFFEKRSNSGSHVPYPYYGKRICSTCNLEFKAQDKKAIPYEEWKAKQLSSPEHKEWKAKHPDLRRCNQCGYYEELRHDLGGYDDRGFFNDESYSIYKCGKFGIDVTDTNQLMADKCSSYITKQEYQEKCLSGKMNNEKTNVQIIFDFSSLKDVCQKAA